jgi:phage terminase large subunit
LARFCINTIQPKQKLFFKARTKYIAYGGTRAGGKSWAMRIKFILLALRYPKLKLLLLRRTFPELESNHILPLLQELEGIARYAVAKKMFIFPNGSFIKLGYCKNEKDAFQYVGREYDVIGFEEATLFTEAQLDFIKTSARNTRSDFQPRIYYTCNPGGVGHHYIKRLFIDKDFTADENPDDYTFIPASIYDNTILLSRDPSYLGVLNSLPEDLRRAHRDGDWDALSGQYFREFRRDTHVIEPFEIPKEWFRYVTIDYGLDCLAAYWIAVDYTGQCYVYREVHESGLIISQAADIIKDNCMGEQIDQFFLPPDMKSSRQETGKSAYQLFIENGITGTMSRNQRVDGWLCMKEYLKPRGENLLPTLRFFSNCKCAIKHIPLLQRSENDPNDVSLEPHKFTHSADAIRYFCSSWVSTPEYEREYISGTYYYGELRMRGYTMMEIRKLERDGHVRVVY